MRTSSGRAGGGNVAEAQRLETSWPAVASSVGAARDCIRAFGRAHGANEEALANIVLAVSEAASNAVMHAFLGREPGTLSLFAEAGAGEVRVSVVDDGSGMAPRADSPGLGLGLPTIGQLTRSVDLRAGPEGTGSEVRMVFAVDGVQGAGPELGAAESRYELLLEVDRIAEGSAWPTGALERLVDLLVPSVADACAVDIIDADGSPRRVAGRVAGPGSARFSSWLVTLRPRVRATGSATETALLEQRTSMAELTPEHIRMITTSEQDAATMTATGVRWWVVVPLREGPRHLGLLHFGARAERGRPSAQTVGFMEAVGERAAGALARTHLIDELQRTRRRLERVLGVLDEAIVVNDPDGVIVYANSAADELLSDGSAPRPASWVEGELPARFSITDQRGNPLVARELPALRVFSQAEGESLLTRWVQRSDGRVRWLRLRAVRLEDGGPLAVNVISDVTETEGSEREQGPEPEAVGMVEDRFLQSAAVLSALYASAPVGMAFIDRALRYQRVSARLSEISGLAEDAYIGRTVREMLGPQLADQVEPVLREVIETGVPVRDHPVSGARPGDGQGLFHWFVSHEPVFVNGRVVGVSTAVSDLTERVRMQQASDDALRRAEFLAQATHILDSSLDFQTTLQNLARSAVPGIADWCSILLRGEGGTLNQVAVAHSDPQKERLAWELNERYGPDPDDQIGAPQVIRTGQTEVINDITDELLQSAASDDYLLGILRDLGLRASLTAPLVTAGRTLGAITLVAAETKQRFDENDVQLAEELARRAAISVENSRLYTAQHQIAETLQRALLPDELPAIPGLVSAARYQAAGEGAEVGGDFYDLFPLRDDRWLALIGDVVGKGARAAAMTAMIRYTLRGCFESCPGPVQMLEHLNGRMLSQYPSFDFCTIALVVLERSAEGWDLQICLGGHAPPLIIRRDGRLEPVGVPGTLIGAFPQVRLSVAEASLAPQDTLLLYTDGLTAGDAVVLGADHDRRLDGLLDDPPADPARLLARLEHRAARLAGGKPRDDVALIALRAAPAGA